MGGGYGKGGRGSVRLQAKLSPHPRGRGNECRDRDVVFDGRWPRRVWDGEWSSGEMEPNASQMGRAARNGEGSGSDMEGPETPARLNTPCR